MYVFEVNATRTAASSDVYSVGGQSLGLVADDTAIFILPADRCTWRTVYEAGTVVTDSGFNSTSYTPNPDDADLAVNGDVTATFPVGTVVSNRADGTNSSVVTEVSYDAGIGSTDITVTPAPAVNWGIASDLYIVTTGAGGYVANNVRFYDGQTAVGEAVTGSAVPASVTAKATLGYVGKSGRFVAITN